MKLSPLLVSVAVAALAFACSREALVIPQETTVKEFTELSSDLKDSTSILICDFRQYNRILKRKEWDFVHHGRKEDRFYYIDISLPANRELQYIFTFNRLPSVLSLDAKGNIVYIEDADGIHQVDSCKSNYYTSILRAYLSLSSTAPDADLIDKLVKNKDLKSNPYANILLARAYDKLCKNDIAEGYWHKAASIYESSPDEILERLYIDALRRLNDTLCHIVFNPTNIVLDDVRIGSEQEVKIQVTNYGNRPFLFTEVIPSCSCVRVSYPRIVRAGTSDTLTVKYLPDGPQGPIDHRVRINPSVYKNKYIINIKGTQQ